MAKTRPKLVWTKLDDATWQSQQGIFFIRRVGTRYRVRDCVYDDEVNRSSLAYAKRWAASRA